MSFAYTRSDLEQALFECGVEKGRVVFVHSNIGLFGMLEGARSLNDLCEGVYGAFRSILGETGTLVVPTFTYSFGSDKEVRRFDVDETPSQSGAFSEYVRQMEGACRTDDPMFSVAAVGAKSKMLTDGHCTECFGDESVWARMLEQDALICNLNLDAGSTFVHFVERRLNVTYRADRVFAGQIKRDGEWSDSKITYFSRRVDDSGSTARFEEFDQLAREAGMAVTRKVGKGAVVAISTNSTMKLIEKTLPENPTLLVAQGAKTAV